MLRAVLVTIVTAGLLVLLDPGTFAGRVYLAYGALIVVAPVVVWEYLAPRREHLHVPKMSSVMVPGTDQRERQAHSTMPPTPDRLHDRPGSIT
jgi:hypothetical protein